LEAFPACRRHVSDDATDSPAILFQVLSDCVVVFPNGNAHRIGRVVCSTEALFGLFWYATFKLTNMSPLKHREAFDFPDIALGRFLTAIAASIGGLLNWIWRKV
jgi:uncharacterized membrane protein